MSTIQDKIERYNQILGQITEHTIESDDISDELFMLSQEEYELKEEITNYICEHKMYKPIENLQKFEGMSLKSITLVNKWGRLRNLKNYDDITVIDGHLFAKNANGDTIEYDPESQKYVEVKVYSEDYLSVDNYFSAVGYINIRIADGLFEDILKDIMTKEVV